MDGRRGSLPAYRRDLPFGWVVGDFAVRELLRIAPANVIDVRYHGTIDSDRAATLERLCVAAGTPWRRDDAAVAEKRSKGSADVMAVFRKPPSVQRPTFARRLCLFEPRDAGNLGSTLRTALAFGVRDVVLVGGIDPWSPHVVRASIGAAFALRLSVIDGLGHLANGEEGATTWYLDARGATTVRDTAPLDEPWTLVVGPEWPGLTDDVVDRTRTIRIDHEADVESLNVTVAVGIALHGLIGR